MRERFGAARGGEEREQRRLLAGEDAALGGAGGDAGALVVAEPEADLVLLDHGHVGVGGGLRAADQGLDGGEARLAGLGVERLQRGEPPPAGDEAVGQRAPCPGHQRRHLDRACAGRARAGSRAAPPSPRPRPAGGRGPGGRGRWRRAAGRAPCGRPRGRGAGSRRSPRAPRRRRPRRRRGRSGPAGAQGRRAAECSARGTFSLGAGGEGGGEAAAGHQAISFSRAAAAAQLVAAPGGEQQPLEAGIGLVEGLPAADVGLAVEVAVVGLVDAVHLLAGLADQRGEVLPPGRERAPEIGLHQRRRARPAGRRRSG